MIDLLPIGIATCEEALVRTGDLRISRFVVGAGEEIPTHEAQGEIILQCLTGSVEIIALDDVQELKADQLLYLKINEPFSIRGLDDAVLLATIILPKQGAPIPMIGS